MTFNQIAYLGFDNWELKAGGVHSSDDSSKQHLSIQDAVIAAGNFRREA